MYVEISISIFPFSYDALRCDSPLVLIDLGIRNLSRTKWAHRFRWNLHWNLATLHDQSRWKRSLPSNELACDGTFPCSLVSQLLTRRPANRVLARHDRRDRTLHHKRRRDRLDANYQRWR